MSRTSPLLLGVAIAAIASTPAVAEPALRGGIIPAADSAALTAPQGGLVFADSGFSSPSPQAAADNGALLAQPPPLPAPDNRPLGGPDPYTQLGLRFGSLVVYPSLEFGTGHVWGDGAIASGATLTATPQVTAEGDFGAVALRIALSATFDLVSPPPERTLSGASAALDLVFDLGSLWSAGVGFAYRFEPLGADDPALPAGYDELPGAHTLSYSSDIGGPIGALEMEASLNVDRTLFGPVSVSGIAVDQTIHDFTVATGTLRIASAGNALFQPFAETTIGRRFYDVAIGTGGFLQSSSFAETRIGVAVDDAPVLTAGTSVGYRWEVPDDPALTRLRGITFDSNATWSPTERLRVIVASQFGLRFEATPSAGAFTRQFSVRVQQDLRQNLVLAGFGQLNAEKVGGAVNSSGASLGTELAWQPSRSLGLTLGYTHRWQWNADPTLGGESDEIRLTARLQR